MRRVECYRLEELSRGEIAIAVMVNPTARLPVELEDVGVARLGCVRGGTHRLHHAHQVVGELGRAVVVGSFRWIVLEQQADRTPGDIQITFG